MKTLGEIIEAARSGERPDYDGLRLAVCAMDMLMTFDRQAIWKLAEAESEGKKPFMVWSGLWQRDENFNRVKRAMAKDPRSYLGLSYDPDSPEVQDRRRKSIALMDRALSRDKTERPS
ncbi:hypothetical protein IFT80_02350 [Pseudomonas sp. CFBP 8771]|uniref:hypothetical protein n=1 Tax=Pseudomonas sp. CFBP 8771 TaxID=2775285 RepID=UPI001786AC65|nr:hypothetical protein [Pseudomonas sp. CFBP 8771]MBD8601477.1 hypothetical protein [Pseudomonas sp. CFBP 8771]